MKNELNKGDKVVFMDTHPWKGRTGILVEYRDTLIGAKPVFRMESGIECFGISPDQYKLIKRAEGV